MKNNKTKKNDEIELTPDREESHTINWFPGHMARAMRDIKAKLSIADLVLEVRDARVPLQSGNNAMDEVLGQKGKLIVFNKANLAPKNITNEWQKYFESKNINTIFVDCFDKGDIKKVLHAAKTIVINRKKEFNPEINHENVKVRMMVLGLPNTGKSTLINQMAGRHAARVADKPGHTQAQQLIKVDNNIELLDTPGVMMPSIETHEHGLWLSLIHAIPEDIVRAEDQACYLIEYFQKFKTQEFLEKYKITTLDQDMDSIIAEIAKARGCIKQKAQIDFPRVFNHIIADFRKGDLGKHCFGIIPN